MTFRIALIPDDTIYVLVVRPNYFQRRIASQETSSSYSFSHCTYVLHDPMLFLSLACTALRPFHFYFLCFFWSESADREASAMVHRPSSAFSFVHGWCPLCFEDGSSALSLISERMGGHGIYVLSDYSFFLSYSGPHDISHVVGLREGCAESNINKLRYRCVVDGPTRHCCCVRSLCCAERSRKQSTLCCVAV